MSPTDTDGARVAEALKAIYDEIPQRLAVTTIIRDAHRRLYAAAGIATDSIATDPATLAVHTDIRGKLVEILREIATVAVNEFVARTGQSFMWKDEPEWEPDEGNVLMHFSVDAKGNVVF